MKVKSSILLLFSAIFATALAIDCSHYGSNNCAGYTGGVTVASPISCRRWLQCDQNNVINCGTCPEGTRFDPATRGCNDAALVECDRDLCDTNRQLYLAPHPDSCTMFVMCIYGDPTVLDCAAGLEFDHVNQRCDEPEIALCDRK